MPQLAKDILGLKGQPMFNILTKCKELEKLGVNIKHFELGDPDFMSPEAVVNKTINSLKSGNTHYQPSRGSLELLESVQETTELSRKFKPDIKQITITTGANAAIFYSLKAICDPGDEIILPNPYFPTYIAAAQIAGIKSKFYNLKIEDRFMPKMAEIENLITDKTKAIMINSPSNPMGSIISKKKLEQIYEIAVSKDLYIISDEVYSRMIFNDKEDFFSISQIDKCLKYTILINGFSKSFAMTGWRIGTAIAPQNVSEKITLLSESIASCVPGFIQEGAIEALALGKYETQIMYDAYRRRQKMFIKEFEQVRGMKCLLPEGSMYVFPSIKEISNSSESFALHLLKKTGIACVPGIYFGSSGEGHLRFSCAGSEKDIKGISSLISSAILSYSN